MTKNDRLSSKPLNHSDKGGWHIRDMAHKDIDEILEIERRSFPTPWTKTMFLESFSSDIYKNFVIEEQKEKTKEVIGYLMTYYVLSECHITNFAVKPQFRKKGYGTILFSHVIDYFRKKGVVEFFLEVRESNNVAINLYRKFGFEIVGRRKRYYSDTNEDAFIMYLSLNKKTDTDCERLAG
ncbi:MAG TPA: ribosomal protein S18-alanine N-acetyltransferase [Syntrophorhabdaceae bacterium]|nr:ribosomal protein S18-alanine N-acetyltransferase [Syntrophorhabdaceae bacterium]